MTKSNQKKVSENPTQYASPYYGVISIPLFLRCIALMLFWSTW